MYVSAAEAIQYFIKQKIRDDLAWQRINIVFSGSEVRTLTVIMYNGTFLGAW